MNEYMKLKIAVTDANVFIDLFDVGLMDSFFNLDLEIHTSAAVLYELYLEQQEVLETFRSAGKLAVHNLQEQDFIEIYTEKYLKIGFEFFDFIPNFGDFTKTKSTFVGSCGLLYRNLRTF